MKDNLGFAYHKLDEELEEQLSWEARNFRDSVRAWVKKPFMDVVTECNMTGRFPTELLQSMVDLGLLGIKTDPEYGGSGQDNITYGLVCRELEAGDSGLRSAISVQNSLIMFPIQMFGSDEQKEYWLPLLAAGKALGAFGLTGPEGGSDPENMKTFAKKDGSDYVINGSKQFITTGDVADFILLWAKLEDAIRCFLVPKGTPGFESVTMKNKLSLRVSNTAELFFRDVRIPAENILPGTLTRKKAYLACLNEARYGIAWGAVGAAAFCAEAALEYASNRTLFGCKLTKKQLTQQKLEWMDEHIEASLMRAITIAKRKDAGVVAARDISRGKKANVSVACDVARLARRMIAGNGIMAEYHVMRHMMNLESVYTYEGTDDVHLLAIGRAITGENAF